MWAVTMTDYNNDPGFVYFYSSKPYELNKTGIIKSREEDEFRLWHMLPGATWHNGEYLGYTYMMYTYVNHVKGFVSVDLEKEHTPLSTTCLNRRINLTSWKVCQPIRKPEN